MPAFSIEKLTFTNPTYDPIIDDPIGCDFPSRCEHPKVVHDDHEDCVIHGRLVHRHLQDPAAKSLASSASLEDNDSETGPSMRFEDHGEATMRFVNSKWTYVPVVEVKSGMRRGEALQKHLEGIRNTRQTPILNRPKSRKFILMMALTGSFFLVELITGVAIGSLALVTDAYHMLSDLVALVVGLYSAYATEQRTDRHSYSYGKQKMEVSTL